MADRGIALKAASGTTKSGRIVPAAGVSPEHAQIEMFEPKHVDGKTQLGAPQGTINFQFNPKEVTISKSAKWERKPVKGKKSGPPEYSGAEPCKLTLELFFDSTMDDKVNVVNAVDDLFRCCVPCKEAVKGQKPMPFLVKFKWGGVTSFPAFVTQVQAKYTRFTTNGIPIRAVCTVNLEELDITAGNQNPTSGTMSADRVHTMVTGDTLALLAYQEYGDPALWRPLADYNRVDDPMRIADGARLLLPPADALLRPVG